MDTFAQEIIGRLKLPEGNCPSAGQFTEAQKIEAVRLAERLGPDWAQALYHYAVLLTRLA